MIPLYITHNGDGFTARYSEKEQSIIGCKEIHLVDFRKHLFHGYCSASVAIRTEQDFSDSEQYRHSYEESLVEWVQESTGASYRSCMSDNEALRILVSTHLSEDDTISLLIYENEHRITFSLVESGQLISTVHFALKELECGIDTLLARVGQWYTKRGITTRYEKTYYLGTYSGGEPLPPSITLLFSNISVPYLIAAGVSIASHTNKIHSINRKNQITLQIRRGTIVFSLIFCAVVLITYGLLLSGTKKVEQSITESNFNTEFSSEVVQYKDSLQSLAQHHLILDEKLSSHRRWSDIIDSLSAIPHDGIVLQRFGSRSSGDILTLAFEGQGVSEKSVTGFVESIKSSSSFTSVQLTQLSREPSGKQRFRIQCNIK